MYEFQSNDVGEVTISVSISKQHADNKIRFYSSIISTSLVLGLCVRKRS